MPKDVSQVFLSVRSVLKVIFLNLWPRPFDARAHILCSPCDGFASVYPIHKNMRITIKHTQYTLEQLLRDSGLAARYAGGTAQMCIRDRCKVIGSE